MKNRVISLLKKSINYILLLLSMLASPCSAISFSNGDLHIENMWPNPSTSKGYVELRNLSNTDIKCDFSIKGIISGSKLNVKATKTPPSKNDVLIRRNNGRTLEFDFSAEVRILRKIWNDENAYLSELVNEEFRSNCDTVKKRIINIELGELSSSYNLSENYEHYLIINVPTNTYSINFSADFLANFEIFSGKEVGRLGEPIYKQRGTTTVTIKRKLPSGFYTLLIKGYNVSEFGNYSLKFKTSSTPSSSSIYYFDLGFQVKVSIDDSFSPLIKSKIVNSFTLLVDLIREYSINSEDFKEIDACVLERTNKTWRPELKDNRIPQSFSSRLIYAKPLSNPLLGIRWFFRLLQENGKTFAINGKNLSSDTIAHTPQVGQVYPFEGYVPNLYSVMLTTSKKSGKPYLEKFSDERLAGIFLKELMHVIGYLDNNTSTGTLFNEAGNCFTYFSDNKIDEIYHKDFLSWCEDEFITPEQRKTIDLVINRIPASSCFTANTKLRRLQKLNLGDSQVSDISPLGGLSNLTVLLLSNTQVSGIRPLAGLSNLLKLSLKNTKVRDLSPLAGLSKLLSLAGSSTQVRDINPLAELLKLNSLDLFNTQVDDIKPLARLSKLKWLNLENTPVNDISPLAGLSDLNSLHLSYTRVSDLDPVASLSELLTLNLQSTQVEDISPLSRSLKLIELNLQSTQVKDISPLADLPKLLALNLSETQTNDIYPLTNLSNLRNLYLTKTQVSDIYPLMNLTNLRILYLGETQVTEVRSLANLFKLRELELRNSNVSSEDVHWLRQRLPDCDIRF